MIYVIPVTEEWFKTEGTASFLSWARTNNIDEGDWNFITTAGILSPRFLFRHEADALAFRLRFGL
jgi:hypothetical protein